MPKSSPDKIAKALQKGEFSPVYLLTGEDVFRKREFIAQITAAAAPDEFNIYTSSADKADMGEALALANTAPVFSTRRMVILTGVEKLRKDPKEALARYLQNPLDTTILLLTHNDSKKLKTDKTLAAAAETHGQVANFAELKREELGLWVKNRLSSQGLTADFDAVETLCEAVGADLSALAQEIEKLSLYTADRTNKTISKEDVLAGVGFSKEENPFALSNAVQYLNKNRALALVDKLLDDGEEPAAVLAKISYPVLKMARVKRLSAAGMAQAEIMRAAGLMFWEQSLITSARNYPSEAIFLKTLNRIIQTDKAFKTSSSTDPKTALKGVLMTLFSNR